MWVQAAMAAMQIIGALATNSKKQADKRAAASGVDKVSAATAEATARARGQANATTAPGASIDAELARQTSADIVGQAKQTAADSSKVSTAVTRAGILQGRANQQTIKRGEEFRFRAENRLQGALAQQTAEERRAKEAKDKIYMEAETGRANLFGAGANNLMTAFRDKEMMKFYGDLYGSGAGATGAVAYPGMQ